MVRLLLLLAILVVVVLLVRRAVTAIRKDTGQRDAAEPSPGTEAKLVRCVQCGSFVPKADTVPVDNGFRCAAGCPPR